MNRERQLGEELFEFVTGALKNEPSFSAEDKGRIAQHLQREFERKYAAMTGPAR